MASSHMTIDIKGWPEALFVMRKSLADLLRAEADSEADPRMQRRLREIASAFEVGWQTDQEP